MKYFRLSEIEEQKSIKSTWIIINYKVYDVTKFLEEVRNVHGATVVRRRCRCRGKRRNVCGKGREARRNSALLPLLGSETRKL